MTLVHRQLKTETELYQSMQQEEATFKTQVAQQQVQRLHNTRAGVALQEPEYSSLSKDQQKEEDRRYKDLKAKNSFVKGSELQSPYMRKVLQSEVKVGDNTITQQQLFDQVCAGDCTHMQNLDPVLRNRAATEYLAEHPINGTPQAFVASLLRKPDPVSEMLNPRLRVGISLVIHSEEVTAAVRQKYQEIDALLNREIMNATISKKIPADSGIDEGDRQRNIRSQVFMMKSLLSCHVGKFRLRDKKSNPPEKDWEGPVANAFAHCSRVIYTMPGQTQGRYSQTKEDQMLSSFQDNAGFESRTCATHSLHRKRRKVGGKSAHEVKFPQPFRQFGMNIAVGGLGNNGIPDELGHPRMIRNDGSCGHLYMHLERGSKDKHTGMLIGFESDAVGVMNQTGHIHDASATGEFASSFGGQRVDEIGDKYGGREADLSEVNIDTYIELMTLVDNVTSRLLTSTDDNDTALLNSLVSAVTGSLMDARGRTDFYRMLYEANGSDNPLRDAQSMELRMY